MSIMILGNGTLEGDPSARQQPAAERWPGMINQVTFSAIRFIYWAYYAF